MLNKTNELRETADQLMWSRLVWFSQSGSGADIKPVTAAFLDISDAMAWAVQHPGQTVHFPGSNQLQARFAMGDGVEAFVKRAQDYTRALSERLSEAAA